MNSKWQRSLVKIPDEEGDKRRSVQDKNEAKAALPEDVYPETDEHRDDDASALHAVLEVCQVHERFQSHSK